MFVPGRQVLLAALFPLSLLLDLAAANADDWSLYPANSRSCLSDAATSSQCDPSTVAKFNACVCSNGGGFLDSAAPCIYSSDASDLDTVWSTMSTNCGDSGTPLVYTQAKWDSVAKAGSSSSTTKASTAKSSITKAPQATSIQTITSTLAAGQTTQFVSVVTVSPTGTATAASQSTDTAVPSEKSKVGTGVIAGAAAGGAVILGLLALFIFLFLRNRRNRGVASSAYTPLPAPFGPPPSDHNHAAIAVAPEKYNPQAHQYYGSPSPSLVPLYSEQPKYAGQQHGPSQPYAHQDTAYIPPSLQGAVELGGHSATPAWAHELPTDHH